MPPRETQNDKTIPVYRVAYLVTHPVQYYVPLFRFLTSQPDIELTVFFQSDQSVGKFFDAGFGRDIAWDVPLLGGYHHEFLPCLGSSKRVTTSRPFNYGITKRLKAGKYDILWVHGYARWFNWIAMISARLMDISTLVRDEATNKSTNRSNLKNSIKKYIFFPILRQFAAGYLYVGNLNKEYFIENGFDESRLFLAPHCVDNAYFQDLGKTAAENRDHFRSHLGLAPGRPVILYASKFQRRKRAVDLLHAYIKMTANYSEGTRPYLLFVGDGETRSEVEAEAAELGDDVRFLGFRNQSELPSFFDLCDVFVLPAAREPWGLIINEVMNLGRPVVVSDDVGCWPDLVQNGVNGFVYPVGDVDALADALKRTLASKDTVTAMGQASLQIINNWGFEQVLAGLRQAIVKVRPHPRLGGR